MNRIISVLLAIFLCLLPAQASWHPIVDKLKGTVGSAPTPPPAPPLPPFFPISLQPGDKIIIAGDSITQGGTANGGFITVMNQWIQARYSGQGITINGSGVPGNTSLQLAARLQNDVLSQNPTVVILFIGVNDVYPLGNTIGASAIFAPETFPQFQANYFSMIKQCRAYPSVRSVLICTPMCIREQYDGQNPIDNILDLVWQQIVAIAVAAQAPLIDLRQSYLHYDYICNSLDAPMDIFTVDGVHPNAQGAGLIAGSMLIGLGV